MRRNKSDLERGCLIQNIFFSKHYNKTELSILTTQLNQTGNIMPISGSGIYLEIHQLESTRKNLLVAMRAIWESDSIERANSGDNSEKTMRSHQFLPGTAIFSIQKDFLITESKLERLLNKRYVEDIK